METGCTKIFLSNLPSNKSLKMNKNIIPISNGSVGKYKLTGISGTISSKRIDKGAKKTTVSKTLSIEIKLASKKINITGKNAR
jgi:hypothetical protein